MQPNPTAPTTQAVLYLPALDGIRFIAFLLVFVLHSGPQVAIPLIQTLTRVGWVGVDVFFVVSSFLFFHLFLAERAETGRIAIRDFYIRRMLRILPLSLTYPALMLIAALLAPGLFHINVPEAVARYIGASLMIDNFLIWINSYNSAIPMSEHLWTLSFEFQVYLIIPMVFLAFVTLGTKRFMWLLVAVWAWCLVVRGLFVFYDAPYTTIYVTPFLRPESVMVGLTLPALATRSIPSWVAMIGALGAGAALATMPVIEAVGVSTMLLYPVAALFAGCVVWLGLNIAWLSRILASPGLRFLGKISFGLYVYHRVGLAVASRAFKLSGVYDAYPYHEYFGRLGLAFLTTLGLSALSYYVLEKPFLRWKDRRSVLKSRPI